MAAATGLAAVGPAALPEAARRLVDEVRCAALAAERPFQEYPPGVSRQQICLGVECRVLPGDRDGSAFMAFRIGAGRGLRAAACYLLEVDFPDDVPRSLFLCNWGCETTRGVHTGATVGDVLKGRYVNHNPESLRVPQSGRMLTWRQVFFLHDRFPELRRPRGRAPRPLLPADGFWVIVAQAGVQADPLSAGAAVSGIRLYEVPDWRLLVQPLAWPPEGLPRRHVFWREEMADGVVATGPRPEEQSPESRGVVEPADWFEYKLRLMQILGIDTFSRDLLEFGHNQGWDSAPYGGTRWYNQAPDPGLWERVLGRVAAYPGLSVLPYYEYAGSIGSDRGLAIGAQRRCRTLSGGQDYTHIAWCHKTNADLTDPDFLEDARRLLELSIVRHRDKARFLGAWFRPRPEANPISFSDAALARFAADSGRPATVGREQLRADPALRQSYYAWWLVQRRTFLTRLCDGLRQDVAKDAVVLYTCDASEPGIAIPAVLAGAGQKRPWEWKTCVVTDQPAVWERLLGALPKPDPFLKAIGYDRVLAEALYGKALLNPRETWGQWEWQHACPWNDPANYRDQDAVLLTYSFNRLYTVAVPDALEAFRTQAGLAVVRHYALNEHEIRVGEEEILGYFVADTERAGPYSLLAEARALAYGDPRFIGYLVGNSFNRGFPEYARAFYAAFLSLPAVPGRRLDGLALSPEIIVREYATAEYGTWLAAVHVGLEETTTELRLPPGNAPWMETSAPGTPVAPAVCTVTFYPGQVRVFRRP